MRIVLDMQGAQTESRFRGIGRYTLSLAQAIVRNRGEHEIILALSGFFPDTIEPIRAAFDGLLPQENIRVWYAPGPIRECDPGNEWRREVAERIREAFLASLKPDVVHVTSKFEGYVEDAVTSIGVYAPHIPTVVTLYSINPLVRADTNHKHSPVYERFLHQNIESMKRAQGWIQLVDHPIQHIDEGVVPFLKRVVGVTDGNEEAPACFDITMALQCVYSPDSNEAKVNPTWAQNARKAIAIFEDLRAPVAGNLHAYDCVQSLVENINAIEKFGVSDHDVLLAASAIATNHPENRRKNIYVDLSHLAQKDLKTGIQRVARSIVAALINNPPADYQIKPVFATQASHGYLNANSYLQQLTGVGDEKQVDDPIEPQPGDIFLGLDFVAGVVMAQQEYLKWMHNHGVRMYFVVYDLLPTKLPHCFPEGAEAGHRQWLQTIAKFDGAVCISHAVKDELDAWLRTSGSQRHRPFETGWFHLGADVENSLPTKGIPKDAGEVINKLAALPSFLMVGTVEPRKGLTQTLQAFELLWEQSAQVNLIIVGNQGWMVEGLSKRLHKHPELNNRLFWLQGTSDEYLERIYTVSTCLIAASEGEGFGLPLIEAAKHKLPIICRDIPVFREVAGEHAHYFSGLVSENLAQAIETWITFNEQGRVPQSKGMSWITWKESAANLMATILRNE